MTKREEHNAEWYLNDPRTRKWMVRCSACGTIGYRDDAPDKFFGREQLIKYFKAQNLDDQGMCAVCRFAFNRLAQ